MRIQNPQINLTLDIPAFLIGGIVGYQLSKFGNFEFFKLFNIVGITFDIFGVLILSYVITSNERVKNFVTGWGVSIVISIIAFVPMGMFLGLLCGSFFFGHDMLIHLFSYFSPITIYCLLSLIFLEDAVLIPKIKRFESEETRIKVFGGFLLFSGLGIQLIAAVLDFLER